MKFRPTAHELRWLHMLGGIALIVAVAFLMRPFLPASHYEEEPLADVDSLKILMNGGQLPEPSIELAAQFHGKGIHAPTSSQLGSIASIQSVLGDTSLEKRIEVDLTRQKVYAYEGKRKVYAFTVSTGKWALTPTGEFTIWAKVRSQKMEGGNKAWGTYYNLPNVPYVMFFYNNAITKMRGFSFHGTYWHDNFGHPMSHGCVNMKTADAQTLYEWALPVVSNQKAWSTLADASNHGTRVLIYGETPSE